jgi:hypothetical protein
MSEQEKTNRIDETFEKWWNTPSEPHDRRPRPVAYRYMAEQAWRAATLAERERAAKVKRERNAYRTVLEKIAQPALGGKLQQRLAQEVLAALKGEPDAQD